MKNSMVRLLRIKFILVFMGTVSLLLLITIFSVVHLTNLNFRNDSIRTMRLISERPRMSPAPNDTDQSIHMPFFDLMLSQDGTVNDSSGDFYNLDISQEYLQEFADIVTGSKENIGIIKDYNLRYLYDEDRSLIVFADITGEINAIQHLFFICVITCLCALLLFLCISIAISNWIIRPVQEAFSNQQQFVSDASHELKTPITIILTNSELLLDENDPQNIIHYATDINSTAQRMKRLVTELLDLARLDSQSYEKQKESIDLSQKLEEIALVHEAGFYEKGLTLETRLTENIQLQGIPFLLEQLIYILLDNASEHARCGSTVTLRLTSSRKKALISIENEGPTIPSEKLPFLFKRFYQLDPARADNDHYGLGLSIAQKIVQLHNGKIWCESKNDHTVFFIQV